MMRNRAWIVGLFSVILLTGFGCQDLVNNASNPGQGQAVDSQKLKAQGNKSSSVTKAQKNFRTHLKGDNEVPAVETNAQGQAIFNVSSDGTSIHYKLIVANIENVLMAHIHLAPAGANGGVIVWLYPSSPPPQLIEGRFQGVLAEGIITANDLVGSLAGESLEALLEEMQAGNTYVNVHTTQNPGGEVRGQIH